MPRTYLEVMQLVRQQLPRQFLLSVIDHMNAAYASAHRTAANTPSDRPLHARRLGHERHFEREEALMRAAEASGVSWGDATPHVYPKVFVETQNLRVAELKVARWGELPEDTEERRSLAAANPVLGTFVGQSSLFADSVIAERLFAYIVVANPASVDDEFPSSIGIGIPTANLDDWFFLETIETILSTDSLDIGAPQPLPDRARPVLKVVRNQDDKKSE